MCRGIKFLSIIFLSLMLCISLPNTKFAVADEQELFTSGASIQPNVLLILDNSQSMDEDLDGDAIGPYKTGSRLVEGKRALRTVVTNYADQMRIGLMTYKLPSVSAYHLHDAAYFASYQLKSYCPDPPSACVDYCKTNSTTSQTTCQTSCEAQNSSFDATYRDEIITNYAVGSEQRNRYCGIVYPKTHSTPNPNTSQTNYIYYKLPGTFYASSDQGYKFNYAPSYSGDDSPSDTYHVYSTKAGTSDAEDGYSGSSGNGTYGATDEDTALGFNDWGRRWIWYHTSRVWFANSSPGGGYLHTVCDTNGSNNSQRDALLAKLDMKESLTDSTGYMSCTSSDKNTCAYIVSAGLTPTAGTFQSAINYFKGVSPYNSNPTSPITDSCQKNFIIYVTDGLPSVNESGSKDTATNLMPGVLAKIDSLRSLVKTLGTGANAADYTFNIKTYVLGMGLTDASKAQVDLMASHGGTATADGHAYYADKPSDLTNALNVIFSDIVEKSFSFSTASVSSSRLADENYIYEASFEPTSTDPFWKGYLKKWSLKTDGSLDAVLWEAGSKLQLQSAADRTIKTLINGTLVDFKSSDIDTTIPVPYSNMGVADQATANKIIKYVRGYASDPADGSIAINPENWKLGDIFHSNPITIGSPSPYFTDFLDSTNAFSTFRSEHTRASNCSDGGTSCTGYGKRLVVVGANDGQFHAFNASTGLEYWSFIPPNLLPKLQYLAHYAHPTSLTHNFFVDGPVTVADVWLGSGTGATKSKNDWTTLGIFSVGRNDRDYTATDKSAVPQSTKYWSWNSSCDGNLKETYDSTDTTNTYYYCGYYAFDFTNVTGTYPSFNWKLNASSTDAPNVWPYFGEPWSKMNVGRVKINGEERWVGFIGGGYNYSAAASTDMRGKGVFVVDLINGTILWSFTYGASTTSTTSPDMEYPVAAPLSIADTDSDGFIDAAYVGDLKGNMWQFQFCTSSSASTCNTTSWSGTLLLDKISGSDKYPLFNQATMAKDGEGNLWLYWATGDKADPTGNGPAQYVYGLKPLLCRNSSGTPTPCVRNDLDNLTSTQQAYCGTSSKKVGWYINLAGNSEQVLAEPVAFGNILYFTSFVPASGSSTSCTKTGTSYLYAINIGSTSSSCTIGTGAFSSADRRIVIGVGIASAPMISLKPGTALPPDIYVTTSGAGSQESSTVRVNFNPPTLSNRSNMIYWRDRRLQ